MKWLWVSRKRYERDVARLEQIVARLERTCRNLGLDAGRLEARALTVEADTRSLHSAIAYLQRMPVQKPKAVNGSNRKREKRERREAKETA